jgi:hypothetical protein
MKNFITALLDALICVAVAALIALIAWFVTIKGNT